ncbi:related to Deoxyribodipyrimidine photolyase [Phialocephala subalpina]|uniref:Related to Deoxyribodipyrimidine photolyase n=1 Tax=Phialocephala subalpina TaxID=576137 RepID=A0A1L7WNR4_9HELO|nr:related to Deoxyribodipyrimidine photolyase [Phialocephala subalpina]
MPKPRVIYWFRTDLRLRDSPALKAALDLNPEAFWPVWTWDPHYVYRARVGVNRWQFLIDCQNDLSKSITKINEKSKLFLMREAPQTLFPKLFKAWKITHLVFEKDTDSYGRDRDTEVIRLAREAGVGVIFRSGRTLWDSDQLVEKNHGKPTMSISQVQTAGPKVGKIPRPIPAPKFLPDPGESNLDFEQNQPEVAPDFNSGSRKHEDKSYEKISGPHEDFTVPALEELGFPAATGPHRGGETIALEMLDKIIADEKYTATFEKPNTAPTAFEPQATTLLSPHLHFGSLSIREFYWRVQDVADNYSGKASRPPVSLTGQLLFRDMYFAAQASLGYSFGQTLYNSHCRFIPWHLPSKVNHETKTVIGEYHIDSPQAEEWLLRWKYGRTGFPWIDALMRQLCQEGWIHHLGRHAVACFLTRGGCYISWERGAEVFEEWLIDHETACNAGNWQWLSCTAFYAQFYRCYSPIAFPQKWDKEGKFVRRYVPELKGLDKKYIYEPWKAPIADQKKAGVKIEGDGKVEKEGVYPMPMFDFAERRTICLDGMKKAYKVGLYGDDPKVIDGTWRELFDDDVEGPTEGKSFEDAMGREAEGDDAKLREVPVGGDKNDGAVEEDKSGAKEKGGENKGGDATKGRKRKGVQGTLDGHVKKSKKKL